MMVIFQGGSHHHLSVKGKTAWQGGDRHCSDDRGKGIEAVGYLKIQSMDDSLRPAYRKIRRLGDDLIIDARIEK